MPTPSLAVRLPGKITLVVLAGVAALLSVLAVIYQKTFAPFASRSVAGLQAPASCTTSVAGAVTNERKQLFVSCAGFLN
jgi:hypothetical protein